ncbi:MAG: AAA family ATPase [Acidimicrobiia bacterium]|nr:AAA family ATPase [Acidimicrobiia bacterium]
MDDPAAAPGPATTSDFRLLGPLTVVVDGSPVRLGGPRQVAVLARLVLSPGLVVSMEELVDSVWDGDCPSRPDAAVRSYVSNLRRSIEPGRHRGDRRSCIESSPPGYRLVVVPEQLDANRFETLLAAGRSALVAGRAGAAAADLDAALKLWRGEVCEGAIESDALLAYRSRMAELRLTVTELLCEARLELGEHEALVADLEAAVAANPLRERLTELAMLALYRAGRQSDALAACRELHRRLIDELGLSPGVRIQDLEHRILTHDPDLMPSRIVADAPTTGASPTLASETPGGPGPIDEEVAAIEPFVGRDDQLGVLSAAASAIAAGRGASVLISGEPGSGKTSLVAEHCARLPEGVVTWGRCRAVARDQALWPWGQLLDGLGMHLGPTIGRGLDELLVLAPMLGDDEADGSSPGTRTGGTEPTGRPIGEPAVLFRPAVELLRRISDEVPVTIVIDDAQWADDPTLELVSYAAAALADNPVSFIVVWRDTDPGGRRPALRALAGLPMASRIELGPLSQDAVDSLVDRSGAGGRTLARRLRAETGGNARFVTELLRSMALGSEVEAFGSGRDEPFTLEPTANLRDGILHRIEWAHPLAPTVLGVAALHRGGFSAPIVAGAVEEPTPVIEEALEDLVAAGLITEDRTDAETFRFAHPIVARAVLGSLSGPRRARLHAAVGHAMWRQGWPAIELAHHFSQARSTGTSILAARFALEGARQPVELTDVGRLEAIVTKGLDALDQVVGSEALRAELAAFLAQVARVKGRRRAFETMAATAIVAAERTSDPAVLATTTMAATGTPVGGPSFARAPFAGLDLDRLPTHQPVIESCLQRAPTADPTVGALRARLARFTAIPDPHPPAADDALERDDQSVAEPVGSRGTAVATELARLNLDQAAGSDWCRLAAGIRAALDDAVEADEHDRILLDRVLLVAAAEGGDRARFADVVAGTTPVQDGLDRPWTSADLDRCSLRITGLLVLGELAEAERTLELALSRCHRAGISPVAFDRQLLVLGLEQGKPDLVGALLDRPEVGGDEAEHAVLRALAAAERHELDEAAVQLDRALVSPGWEAAWEGRRPLGVIALAVVVAARLDDRALARRLAKALAARRRPVASLWAGTILLGPTGYYHGLAAASAGKRRQAQELLDGASAHARALGARSWLCRILVARAEVADGDETVAADGWRAEATATAAEIGARWLERPL